MGVTKWIGGALGWAFGGPIGAIIGLALGSLVDGASKSDFPFLGQGDRKQDASRQSTRGTFRSAQQRPQTQPGDFEVSLLILASVVIKADGHQDQRELDFVRQQFVSMYGKDRANQAFSLFKNINKQQIPTRQVCLQIKQMMDHASRLQLLHFLFGIARADGMVTDTEVSQIYMIAGYLGISSRDYDSIKAMFYNSSDNAYKILEITKAATNDEVKAAYRKMAKKYHPDKVMHLGKEHQEGAEEKFRQVQLAYEQLQKERGF
ncbi:molecular chaperone DjiA [Subsaximicrobium wynnwilliamsii]|uniref:Molecular chaperone DjiA n=1 Tax=Subsaximicrobium wynnwilliamsii TaxID=291179 RepID=A0A5C6ZK98_9FLAO|nr:TerB family tellurite resistance protein [Subsaximicrobium wynnwilliamsii]TXD83844.1 molecular chaperone DjiA [Subsaximicrobium wynnwilliamsii]TXD89585.1 molecular chaperone DjiA [Subsaximicrobium wynnwilliamsii]TXE02624.1 molecular chaperone DjiA [Subsaximicrobium wynnwilliamsii]